MHSIFLSSILLFACIHQTSPFPVSKIGVRNVDKVSTKLATDLRNYPGQTPPLGFFDPLKLVNRVRRKRVKLYREAELKHGRISMLACVGIVVAEEYHPLFEGRVTGPAIIHFQQLQVIFPSIWLVILLGIAIIEARSINRGWESPEEKTTATAMLKAEYVPGDLDFDPSNLCPERPQYWTQPLHPKYVDLRNKELNNGRLAMIAVCGMVAQELVNGRGIIENLLKYDALTLM